MGGMYRPSIGAYFASHPLPVTSATSSTESKSILNVYAFPAFVSLVLLCLETVYLWFSLPETRGWKTRSPAVHVGQSTADVREKPQMEVKRESVEIRKERLRRLGRLHGLFLLFFSGVSLERLGYREYGGWGLI